MVKAPRPYVLIADPDTNLPATLGAKRDEFEFNPLHVATVRECQRKVTNRTTQLVAACVNPSLGHPAWLALIRDIRTYHPQIPIIAFCDYPPVQSESELAELGIARVAMKPLAFKDILDILSAKPNPAHPTTVQEDASSVAELAFSDLPSEGDTGFALIKAITLVTQLPLQFDIFIRLSSGHYTKLWKAGSTIDEELLAKQAGRGVREYFIRLEDQEASLKLCDELINRMIDNPSIPAEFKVAEVVAAGADVIRLLETHGVNPANVRQAITFVATTNKAVYSLARSEKKLRKLLFDATIQDHAIGTTLMGAILFNHLEVPQGDMLNQLGIALMLHDVGLWEAPIELQQEDESQMSSELLLAFHAHPAESAKILAKLGNLPPALLEAVEQHHMRLGMAGFPKRQGAKVNRIAELIGICDELAGEIRKAGPSAGEDGKVIAKVLNTAVTGFSPTIVQAFERAFLSLD